MGRRRIELFGSDNGIRPGWVTLGTEITSSNYSAEKYRAHFADGPAAHLVGTIQGMNVLMFEYFMSFLDFLEANDLFVEIEDLRPKSPTLTRKGKADGSSSKTMAQ